MPQQQLVIVGGTGIGPITIGLPMVDVRRMLGEPTKQFRKSLDSLMLTDVYEPLGVHAYYDGAGCVEFVESFRVEGAIHLLDGLSVFDTSVATLVAAVSKRGWVCSEESGTILVAPTLGLSFWRADREAARFDAVAVAAPGYFA
jgi:hypothetical protein